MDNLEELEVGLFKTFSRRKVFVTGHTGFKGAWLCHCLKLMGAEVTGYALAPADQPNLFKVLSLEESIRSIIGDLRDYDRLIKVFSEASPEIVFHLGAQSLVLESFKDPRFTYETNINGTLNVLEAIRRTPSVRSAVIVTSDKCYENESGTEAKKEGDKLGGRDPYSSSKACAEIVASAYSASFFTDGNPAIATARAGNVIGGGDWARHRLLPDTVRALANNQLVPLRNPDAVRPWQFVLDSICGYLTLASHLLRSGAEYAGPWNFGPSGGSSLTTTFVVNEFIKHWGSGTIDRAKGEAAAGKEAPTLYLSSEKAQRRLGWAPVYSLEGAIEKTADWYRAFYSADADMAAISRKQIDDYVAAARQKGVAWSIL